MDGESPFLRSDDLEDFNRARRLQPRYIAKHSVPQPDDESEGQELTSRVVQDFQRMTRSAELFQCDCIVVRADDGMSWSAEIVRKKALAQFSGLKVIGLGRRKVGRNEENSDLPQIMELIGERPLLRAAVKHHLTKSYPTLYLARASVLLAIVGIVGMIVAILAAVVKVYTPATTAGFAQYKSLVFLAVAAGIATILGIVIKPLSDKFAPGQKKSSIEMLDRQLKQFEKLAAEQQAPEQYDDFINELATELQGSKQARFVIIDNYERLDPTTRAAIDQYFRVQRKGSSIAEYWLIFELPDGQGFSHAIDIEKERYEVMRFAIFRQLPLSPASIRELAQVLELKEVPPGRTVKWICHAGLLQQSQGALKLIQQYRADHPANPEQYGDLEFYYLLSAAAIPTEIEFTRGDLLSRLSKGKQRTEVLKLLLKNTRADYPEFDRRLKSIQETFKLLIETSPQGDKVTVLREPAIILEGHVEGLGLQNGYCNSGLLHLYWSIYWHDICQDGTPQAFFLRKLRTHLLKADVDKVPPRQRPEMVQWVFKALDFAIENCLKTCLFDDLPKLVARSAEFYSQMQGKQKFRDALLRNCWDVFSISGSQEVLSTILRLEHETTMPEPEADLESSPLLQLFLAATPMDQESRDTLGTAFQTWFRRYENGRASSRNAEAVAGCFISSMAALVPRTGRVQTMLEDALDGVSLLLASSFEESQHRIDTAFEDRMGTRDDAPKPQDVRVRGKKNRPQFTEGGAERKHKTPPMAADIITLTMCVWAFALRAQDELTAEHLVMLISMADKALIAVTVIKSGTSGPQMQAVLNALARELCAVALAALLLTRHFLSRAGDHDPSWDRALEKLVGDGLAIFTDNEKASNNGVDLGSKELLSAIDAELSLCALIWVRFGLERLRDFAYLRRLQFNFICRGISPDDHVGMQPFLEPVSVALAGNGAMAVFAYCTVASCLRAANDLSVRYLRRASLIVLKGQFDPRLQNEIALTVIYHGHALGIDLERHLKTLLEEDAEGRTTLRDFLVQLPDDRILDYSLRFLNISGHMTDQSAAAEVEKTIADAANIISDDAERRHLLSLLELVSLERHAKHGDVLPSADELLAAWSDRKHLWMFAAVMLVLIQKTQPTPEHWTMALSLLQHDPSTDETTSYLNLALSVAENIEESAAGPQQRAELVYYLQRSVTRWESLMSVEANLRVYQRLSQLDLANSYRYEGDIQKWEKIRIERDHLDRLPELVDQKKFFLIFHEYYDSARFWGLGTDASREEWREFARANNQQRREYIRSWIEEGGVIPQPLLGPQHSAVSARFLWTGYRLFSPPFYDDPLYEDYRSQFNDLAKDSLSDLSDAILRLPKIPSGIRDLMAYHSRQLLSYAGIAEKPGKYRRVAVKSCGASAAVASPGFAEI